MSYKRSLFHFHDSLAHNILKLTFVEVIFLRSVLSRLKYYKCLKYKKWNFTYCLTPHSVASISIECQFNYLQELCLEILQTFKITLLSCLVLNKNFWEILQFIPSHSNKFWLANFILNFCEFSVLTRSLIRVTNFQHDCHKLASIERQTANIRLVWRGWQLILSFVCNHNSHAIIL